MFIKSRTDISEWLIHFVRDRDPSHLPGSSSEVYEYWEAGDLEPDAPASSVLQRIIDDGGIVSSMSFRQGKTTLYGGCPVVCFTEAPLYNFVKYIEERADTTKCSHYGICLLKSELFTAGGRPVIYSAAGTTPPLEEDNVTRRILDPNRIPLEEQFRYVAYDPTRIRPLDWTHEREWRWVATDDENHCILKIRSNGDLDQVPALPIFRPLSEGGYFTQLGFLVPSRTEACKLAERLLGYADSGCNNYDEPYSKDLIRNAFVVPLDEINQRGAQRIEDLTDDLRITGTRQIASEELRKTVRSAIKEARKICAETADEFLKSAPRSHSGHITDGCGGACERNHDNCG